jgi:hypothetical protein
MPFRPMDLQTSLPRTAEMSPLAQLQQHRAVTDQAMLAQQTIKSVEHQAQSLTHTESTAKGEISDGQPRGGDRQPSKGKKQPGGTAQEPENRSEHPFKGKHIDFMG